MIIIVMGVSGSGKTTIGNLLANHLEWQFYEGDDFHSQESIKKMASGVPLTDDDRAPWLERLRDVMGQCRNAGTDAVIACSALRQSYRTYLAEGASDVRIVYLKGDYEAIRERIIRRHGHFMKDSLLESQFSVLEEPTDAIVAYVSEETRAIITKIVGELFSNG
jgi:gluconokinase